MTVAVYCFVPEVARLDVFGETVTVGGFETGGGVVFAIVKVMLPVTWQFAVVGQFTTT